jgi:hypothetical protein
MKSVSIAHVCTLHAGSAGQGKFELDGSCVFSAAHAARSARASAAHADYSGMLIDGSIVDNK